MAHSRSFLANQKAKNAIVRAWTVNGPACPLKRNYDSDREKSKIDSDIRVLNIRQRLTAHSGRRNCILHILQ